MNEISEEILRGCVSNDQECRKLLYQLYYKKMYAICLRYAGDSHEAKDLLHDGFMKMFDRLKQVESVNTLDPWIKRLFANHCIDYLRSAYKKYIKYEPYFNENILNDEESELETDLIYDPEKITETVLMDALNQLKPDYRAIINMYAIEKYSHLEISEKLGISHSTSRSKLLRARKALKNIILNPKK